MWQASGEQAIAMPCSQASVEGLQDAVVWQASGVQSLTVPCSQAPVDKLQVAVVWQASGVQVFSVLVQPAVGPQLAVWHRSGAMHVTVE